MPFRLFHRPCTALLILGLFALALFPARTARAIGVCEAAGPTAVFQVLSYSVEKKELAVRRVDEVCDEIEEGGALDEKWRKLRYATIHDGEGAVVHAYVEGGAEDRKRLLQARPAEIRDTVLASAGQLSKYLKAGHFQPLSPRPTSENGACTVRLIGEKGRGTSNVRIEVRAGDETLAMLRLVGESRKGYERSVYFLQPAQLVAIYTALPQPYGMPPPEIKRTPALTFLPVSKYPKLARCFQAAATSPNTSADAEKS